MATYQWYKQGYAVPYNAFGMVVLRKKLDVPAILVSDLAGYSPLADTNGHRVALATTGFAINDVLNIFKVPAGFHVIGGGVRISTAGTDHIDIGVQSTTETKAGKDVNYWLASAPISSTTTTEVALFDHADGNAFNAFYQDCYITDGSIDVVFLTSVEAALIADFWVVGAKVF